MKYNTYFCDADDVNSDEDDSAEFGGAIVYRHGFSTGIDDYFPDTLLLDCGPLLLEMQSAECSKVD